MFVDSHVNLHGERYQDDLAEVLTRAREARVNAMLAISDQLSSTEEIKSIVAAHANMWRTVGVHPHHAKDYSDLGPQTLIDLASESDVVGIGECGLDYYYEYSERQYQDHVFRAHIEASQYTELPLVIHTRDADENMMDVLHTAYLKTPYTPLLHCYTSGLALAELVLGMGGYVSFSGIITFKKADEVRAVAKEIPLDRLLIETDCPFLAPVPHRGKRNEPSFVPHVAEKLAEIKGVTLEEIARATTDNFYRLFAKAEQPS